MCILILWASNYLLQTLMQSKRYATIFFWEWMIGFGFGEKVKKRTDFGALRWWFQQINVNLKKCEPKTLNNLHNFINIFIEKLDWLLLLSLVKLFASSCHLHFVFKIFFFFFFFVENNWCPFIIIIIHYSIVEWHFQLVLNWN